MNGLAGLIELALIRMAYDEDFEACCNKPHHKAEAISRAMWAEAMRMHDEARHEHIMSMVTSFATCDGFPCRLIEERRRG